ncbi:MAG TPA: antitoxin [Acidimicrobiales bacterium]|nr:antitoxin [Acidimicrobiales bacterium]
MPQGNEGIFDKVRDAAERVTDKLRGAFGGHRDKADDAIEKTGDFVNDKTGDKYAEHVDKAQDAAHDVVDKIAGDSDKGGGATT